MPITKRHISTLLNGLYIGFVALFLLDAATSFDIKSQPIKSVVYYGLIAFSPIVFVWHMYWPASWLKKLVGVALPLLSILLILIAGPTKIIFASSAWRTQTVLYENSHFKFKKIEYQMQDKGALGYNKRTVEVIYLTKFFMIAGPAPADVGKHAEWVKVDRDVNELGLK